MESKLLTYMFDFELWKKELPEFLEEKHINVTIGKQLCTPQVRLQLYLATKSEQLEISPPYAALIPKDKPGEFRRVWINETVDRWWLRLANCALNHYCSSMIHPCVKSYQRGLSSQETVQEVSREIVRLGSIREDKVIGGKFDLTKFFDSVPLDVINATYDRVEEILEVEHNTDPVINILRKYYNSDLVFDEEGNLIHLFTSLKQGSSVSGFLANVCLYDFDEKISKLGKYYRYSDDLILLNDKAEESIEIVREELAKKNLTLNPKKVEILYANKWFKFLGFNLLGDKITLSKRRVKDFTKEIYNRTLAKPWITPLQAKENVKQFLYGNGDGYSWATACFSALRNCDEDILTLDKFIFDAIRMCEIRYEYNLKRKQQGKKPRKIIYTMRDIGGIGVETCHPDKTLIRHHKSGRKVGTARKRTEKEIENYLSIGCLLNNYKMGKPVYEACVRSM